MARFLCGTLPLEIEVARFSDVKREFGLCKLCSGGVLEDEIHIQMCCTALEDPRKRFIHPIMDMNPEKESLSEEAKLVAN